jgi:hypothetical protein
MKIDMKIDRTIDRTIGMEIILDGLHQDEKNYILKYWKNKENFDFIDESDNSGNRTGRKIIWYYIKHIMSPFKNYRRIKKCIKKIIS